MKKSLLKNVSRVVIVSILVGLMVLPSVLSVIGSTGSSTVVMVRFDDRESTMAYIESLNLNVIEDYGGFVLLDVPDSILSVSSRLKEISSPVDYRIGFDSVRFNPDEGVPEISPALSYNDESSHIYILQFVGPVKNEWKAELSTYGVEIYNYIPRNSFLAYIPAESKARVSALPFVHWVGLYQPAYKISPNFNGASGDLDISIYVFKGWDARAIAAALQDSGVKVSTIYGMDRNDVIVATAPSDMIDDIAKMYGVQAVDRNYPNFLVNEDATWIHQTDQSQNRSVFNHGVTGNGIVVTEMDSQLELDHEMFYDPNHATAGPDHRKVVDMYVVGGGDLSDGNYHGQHVAGTICGDAPATTGGTDWHTYNGHDGNAYDAKLIFQDIDPSDDQGGSVSPPSDMRDGYNPSYDAGSRIHSNSWGDQNSKYTGMAVQSDQFIFNHPDYTVLFAMGNAGNGATSLSSQAESKDVISVGATENQDGPNGNQEQLADFSSRGYADDGRIKPTICTVGDKVTSAQKTDGTVGNSDDTEYYDMSGTSMATPGAAGLTALVRQYFQDGYYPTGTPNSQDSLWPSSALVKAILVNSADEMSGSEAYKNDNRYPNGDQGWGRVNLENALYFPGDARKLVVFDNSSVPKCESPAQFSNTGEHLEYRVWVEDTSQPLEITLVWADFPGADNANPAIVNDLDLTVTAPNGDKYIGNVYTGTQPGHSVANPTSSDSYNKWDTDGNIYDDINVVESVLLVPGHNTIQTGKYTIRIDAADIADTGVNFTYQQFAVVATGGLDVTPPTFSGIEGVSDDHTGTSLTLSWSAASDPSTPITYNIYRSTTPGGEDFSSPTYCGITGTSFQDTGLTEGVTYYYVVRAVDNAYNEDMNAVELSGTPSTTQDFNIPVHTGWNLVSYPLDESGDIESVLDDSDVSWDYAEWYTPSDSGDHWKTHVVGRGLNDLNTVDNTMGIWLHVTDASDGYLTISGNAPTSTAIPLTAGWNLVSYPSSGSAAMNSASLPASVTKIAQYNPSATYLVSEVADWSAGSFVPGNAYWIYSTADATWTVDY